MNTKQRNAKCPLGKCDGSGVIEVDPRNPREASTPQLVPCECEEEKAEYQRSVAYDNYKSN